VTAVTVAAMLDGDRVLAPAPGWFHALVAPEHLVMPGDVIGELEVLGRTMKVTAPAVRGIARFEARDARRAVAYGDVLFTVDTSAQVGGSAAAETHAASTRAAAGLVFRAPTSGRFYGRPTPDKPAFVTAGAELSAGTTVCLLEVMKTFHRVTYGGPDVPARARVREVLVADGADVNLGDPLLALDAISV
jgi:acetyl-CoA carboxylase biotin carboxyl carrier protein